MGAFSATFAGWLEKRERNGAIIGAIIGVGLQQCRIGLYTEQEIQRTCNLCAATYCGPKHDRDVQV